MYKQYAESKGLLASKVVCFLVKNEILLFFYNKIDRSLGKSVLSAS
jgi:hypothetical protein